MVGSYGGCVTVTEAAALSAVVALGVSLLFYRGFHWTETLSVVAYGLRSAASIMLIIATALTVGHWVTESGAPTKLVEFLLSHQFFTWQFLLAINALLLVLGCFLEVTCRRRRSNRARRRWFEPGVRQQAYAWAVRYGRLAATLDLTIIRASGCLL